ncbi:MAG: hypothetical protein V4670_05425 [Bacteroidota bacterium]
MKAKILILSMFLSFVAISCSDQNDTQSDTISSEEVNVSAKIDIANDDIIDIAAEQEANTYIDNVDGRSADLANSTIATCADITRVPARGTAITAGTTVTKTINFGAGCTLANGNVVKGKIIITFVYQPDATEHTITYTFENFYHNNIKIEGTKTFTRTMTTETPNSPSHPIVTMNMDITVILPDGRVFTRTGQRIREIIEGYGTVSWTDNVYQITGSWVTTSPTNISQTATITTPLIIKMSCVAVNKPLIVSGIITFERNGNTATLDFGDGTCDNTAVFTNAYGVFTIDIGN